MPAATPEATEGIVCSPDRCRLQVIRLHSIPERDRAGRTRSRGKTVPFSILETESGEETGNDTRESESESKTESERERARERASERERERGREGERIQPGGAMRGQGRPTLDDESRT